MRMQNEIKHLIEIKYGEKETKDGGSKMKIIISPAKKMIVNPDIYPINAMPQFLERTGLIKDYMQKLTYAEAKKLWGCNDKIAEQNFERFKEMDLKKYLTAAIVSYDGIQYQYMAPSVFTEAALDYVEEHLRILSGFYGVLRPFDGVVPYRLEMQAKAQIDGTKDLYEFWGNALYQSVLDEDRIILNLASKEYSKCIEYYLRPEDIFVTCVFGEWKDGKVIQKGTQAKMARGEMVRFMAENGISMLEEIKEFEGLGYHFREKLSSEKEYVFVKEPESLC